MVNICCKMGLTKSQLESCCNHLCTKLELDPGSNFAGIPKGDFAVTFLGAYFNQGSASNQESLLVDKESSSNYSKYFQDIIFEVQELLRQCRLVKENERRLKPDFFLE